MKTTVNAVLINLAPEQEKTINHLQTLFSSAARFAYQRLLQGNKKKDIQKLIQNQYGLNSRYASDAIEQARQLKQSQEKILNLQIENWQTKVKIVEQQIAKNNQPEKDIGLQAKLNKRKRKLAYWQKFKDQNTLPQVIFGGRKQFIKRCKNQISKDEYRASRDNRLLSRGDISKKGNPNTRLVTEGEKVYLIINTDQYETRGKVKRYIQLKVEVYLPWKPSKKTGAINGHNYRQMVLDYLITGQPYQIELIRKNGHHFCRITLEESEASKIITANQGIVGIDTNPNGLALTLISSDGSFKKSWWLGNGELTNSRSKRRRNLIGETVKAAIKIAQNENVAIVIENLKFKDNRDLKPKVSRKIHQFTYTRLLQGIEREAKRQGIEVIKINPAYTSIIGRCKYQKQYGLSTHQAAALVIGRRGYNYPEKLPKAVREILPQEIREKNKHHWSQWHVANITINKLRKAGVKPAFLVA